MEHPEKVARLRTMLEQVATHSHDLESVHVPPPSGAGITELVMPGRRGSVQRRPIRFEDANAGIQKLKQGRDTEVTPEELLAIEAIVMPTNRPVAFIRHGSYDKFDAPWEVLNQDAVRARIEPLLGSVGRIELPNTLSVPFGGTGFLVGDGLLMTNRHVARLFAEGLGDAGLVYRPGDAAVDFGVEAYAARDDASCFTIEKVLMIHPYWDMALVRVAGLARHYTPLTMATHPPEDLVGRQVVVVGYPAQDHRNDMALQDSIFQGVYNVKRLQPGTLQPRQRILSFENDVHAMVHNSSTLGGDSGAAVIDVESGRVVGLHFGGIYLKANFAVPAFELARDARVVDSGMLFDARLPATDAWEHAWRRAGASSRSERAAPARLSQPAPAAQRVQPQQAAAPDARDHAWSFPISLRISVEPSGLGGTARAGSRPAESFDGQARLSMQELQQLVRDPGVDDATLSKYFSVNPDLSRPFAPAVIPNPLMVEVDQPADIEEGAMMMSWANDLSRVRRHARFKARQLAGDRSPVLVSEGDSWFQFPMLLTDVTDVLQHEFNVWSVAAAGDTLQNMVLDNAEYLRALRRHAGSVKAFLFSGGGNDIVGEDASGRPAIELVVKPYQAGKPAAWYVENEALVQKLKFIEQAFHAMILSVSKEFPHLPIICHGYDHAVPGGWQGDSRNPAWAASDKWLGKPLREKLGIRDPALQREIVRLLIDRLNDTLRALCGGNHPDGLYRNAWHVDARGAVERWADELHPDNEGFRAVAGRFRAVLHQAMQGAAIRTTGVGEQPTPNLDDDAGVEPDERSADRIETYQEAPDWRVARSLLCLRDQINRMAPRRSRASDGTIGDAAHRSRNSDHNPWVSDGGVGVVTAMDITDDPDRGCSAERLAQAIQSARDKRIKYVIWNRRIMSSRPINGTAAWQWRPYSGANPHRRHIHISLLADKSKYDSTDGWTLNA